MNGLYLLFGIFFIGFVFGNSFYIGFIFGSSFYTCNIGQGIRKHVQINGDTLLLLFRIAVIAFCIAIGIREIVKCASLMFVVKFEIISIQVFPEGFHNAEKAV